MADGQKEQSGGSNRVPMSGFGIDEVVLKPDVLCASILNSLPIGIVTFDRELNMVYINVVAANLIDIGLRIDESLARGTNKPGVSGIDWSAQLKPVIDSGKVQRFESVSYSYAGRVVLLGIVCTPVKDADNGRILGGTVILEDITEKVAVQRELARAQKLATIGKLASKVAHELNNPMDGILRYINLALRTIEAHNLEKPKEYLLQSRQGLLRMVNIVTELLEFSRSSHAPFEQIRLEHIIEDAIKTMAVRAQAQGVRIERNYSTEIPEVRSGNLFQVFCNLIKNALDAMPDGGLLDISSGLSEGNSEISLVRFSDTGTGFDAANSSIIFEPFFTTKARGDGTGLGLAICKDIVERAGGRITAQTASAGGSVFTVYLPLREQIEGNF
jgi:signal transduction histidine kinase